MAPVVLKPFSSGTLTVSSANTFDKPIIDCRYLTDEGGKDRQVLLEGLKLVRRIARLEPLTAYLGDSVQVDVDNATDEELIEHIKNFSDTVYHPMCTAKIGEFSEAQR